MFEHVSAATAAVVTLEPTFHSNQDSVRTSDFDCSWRRQDRQLQQLQELDGAAQLAQNVLGSKMLMSQLFHFTLSSEAGVGERDQSGTSVLMPS